MKLSRAEADDRIFQGVRAHAPMNAITYDPLRRLMYYPELASFLSELHPSSRTAGNIAFKSFAAEMQLAEMFDPSCAKVNDNPQNAAPALAPLDPVQRLRIVRGSQISSPYKSDAAPAMMTPMNAMSAKLGDFIISIELPGNYR
jgi:hypothetical protein